jgi:hypothetical protein
MTNLLRLTAAVPSKGLLSVVTLSWNGVHLYLVPSATTFLRMGSEDQLGVRQFACDVWNYFSNQDVDEILVRRGPSEGPRKVSTGTTKIETVLQLMPFTCAHVHVQRVTGWANRENWLLPLTQKELPARERDLQELAIETAAFGVACVLTHPSVDGEPTCCFSTGASTTSSTQC